MRWLGVDPGERRVGLAITDPEERLAVPLEVIDARAALPAIRAIARREGVGGVVIGLPLTMAGKEGEAARMARRLGERVRRALGLCVEYEDERLSSFAAGSDRDRARDDLAAAIVLQQFIDRRRGEADRATSREE